MLLRFAKYASGFASGNTNSLLLVVSKIKVVKVMDSNYYEGNMMCFQGR